MAGGAGYTIRFPPDWYRWEVGTGARVADGRSRSTAKGWCTACISSPLAAAPDVTALRAARAEGGIRPLFAALQGETGLAGLYGELNSVNAATLPLTQAALVGDIAAGGTWMTAASADAFQNVVGFDAVGDWIAGGNEPITAAGMFTWLYPDPSPAANLNLNR